MKNIITINGKEYKVKPTIRAMFLFEQITKKSFKIESLLDNYIYFYSLILANNDDVLDWDEYLDALDNDVTIYQQLSDVLTQNSKIEELLNQTDDNTKGEKKN